MSESSGSGAEAEAGEQWSNDSDSECGREWCASVPKGKLTWIFAES